jgi:hypothetical protein
LTAYSPLLKSPVAPLVSTVDPAQGSRWDANGFVRRFLSSEEWAIGLVPRSIERVAREGHLDDVEWLPTPHGYKWLADPFSFARNGVRYVVCEGMRRFEEKGHLVIASLEELRSRRVRVLAEDSFHFSYPFLLEAEGRVYCVPETYQNGRVCLYELVPSGAGWALERRATLVEGESLCDPTLFHHRDRYWLFATTSAAFGSRDLHLYSSPTLHGTFRPHPRNPVKRNLAGARPAGTPFLLDGRILRPSQDCSVEYGRRIILHEITRLTEEGFAEIPFGVLEPDPDGPYPCGLHTISSAGRHCLVDGKALRTVLRPRSLVNRYGAALLRRASLRRALTGAGSARAT